ncbi:unnamed protein product [Medioppia subpectinata]|uniref:Exosome complex component RRP45 n=1 Tax=Medioppia subpectinata TaxID=1979941 RepID=A0A7R9KE83_9ACAR|nr:unnamed protein product [Medioppia subpectinata]CAG2101704.1 unnamed protein product [Medioppia subpectinata]
MKLIYLYILIGVEVILLGAELVASQLTHSLIILGDAYHTLYNILSILLLVISFKMSSEKTVKNTFGWARIEVLGMLVNMTFLVALTFSLLVEGIQQLVHSSHEISEPTNYNLLFAFGVFGFIFNLIYFNILSDAILDQHKQRTNSLSLRAQEKIVFNNILGLNIDSPTGIEDTEAKDVSEKLLTIQSDKVKDTGLILLQTVPENINVGRLKKNILKEFPIILNIHDLHIWCLNASRIVASCHIILPKQSTKCFAQFSQLLDTYFRKQGIVLATVQPEFYDPNTSANQLIPISCLMKCSNVFATTSADITEPKISRPNEGIVELSLDLCSGSEKWLDSYQRSLPLDGIHCLRFLERSLKDSRALDTESLCLVSGEKVWTIRCHIICLNFDGNLLEASSVAAIASLSHFKRPEVTVSVDRTLKIHSFDEKHALNLTLLHYPFCVSFAFFVDNNIYRLVCDPNQCEEESADALLVVSANTYREIIGLHCFGKPVIDSEKVINCSQKAIERVKYLTEFMKNSLQTDKEKRINSPESIGFANAIRTGIMSGIERPEMNLLDVIKVDRIEEDEPMEPEVVDAPTDNVYLYGRGIGGIGEGGKTQWQFNDQSEQIMSDESNDEILTLEDIQKQKIEKMSDEEEEDVMIIETVGFDKKK